MSQDKINRLNGYKRKLTNGSDCINVINNRLSQMFDQFNGAVKGDYYSISYGDFSSLNEKSPGNDGHISNAKHYIQKEIDEIERELEEERKRKEAEALAKAQAGPNRCPGSR